MMKVLIADDHIIVRSFLQLLLERADDIQIVAVASNGRQPGKFAQIVQKLGSQLL
jgi:DNA-binding NarL/FixJ family response regulator